MSKIFISYRRDDSADVTGRIYDRLIAKFDKATVFKDVDSIPYGVNFKEHLENVVAECVVELVVIGPQWLSAVDEGGQRRLDDPDDYVRIEVESALKRGIPVIPLLVRGASMPSTEELPETLSELAFRNGTPVRSDPDFHNDVDRLLEQLVDLVGQAGSADETVTDLRRLVFTATLTAISGPARGQSYQVTAEMVTSLGRESDNEITIEDSQISRKHAQIEPQDDGLWLTDLGSTNKTFVNGQPITEPHRLSDGDEILIGTSVLSVALSAKMEEGVIIIEDQPTPLGVPPLSQAGSQPQPMSDMPGRIYEMEGVDLNELAEQIRTWFFGQGYQSQIVPQGQAFAIQGRKESTLRAVLGMSYVATVILEPTDKGFKASVGGGKWMEKAAVAAVGIALGLGAITAGLGALGQKSLEDDLWTQIDQFATLRGARRIA